MASPAKLLSLFSNPAVAGPVMTALDLYGMHNEMKMGANEAEHRALSRVPGLRELKAIFKANLDAAKGAAKSDDAGDDEGRAGVLQALAAGVATATDLGKHGLGSLFGTDMDEVRVMAWVLYHSKALGEPYAVLFPKNPRRDMEKRNREWCKEIEPRSGADNLRLQLFHNTGARLRTHNHLGRLIDAILQDHGEGVPAGG